MSKAWWQVFQWSNLYDFSPIEAHKLSESIASASSSTKHENIPIVDSKTHNFLTPFSFECSTCFLFFNSRKNLNQHKRDEHSSRQKVVCPKCGKVLSDAYALVRHERNMHSGIEKLRETALECDLCPYKTKLKIYLRKHVRGCHTTERKVICDICGKTMTNKDVLKTHKISTHSELDPSAYVPCPVCQKKFKFRSLMLEHNKLVHEKSKS